MCVTDSRQGTEPAKAHHWLGIFHPLIDEALSTAPEKRER